MKNYVVGFILNEFETEVLLVEKKRPEEQVGFLNGIGGLIEGEETPKQAMIREAHQESNVKLREKDFSEFARLTGPKKTIHFFIGQVSYRSYLNYETMTDEDIISVPIISWLGSPRMLPDVHWLLPMGLAFLRATTEKKNPTLHIFQKEKCPTA